ncbi:hypothetical protein [Actinomyces ruminis]|uniref:PH domain-containing protein n=1 Tax=Actinomyces ruminis TaxID=1937003 RepID=A0ABX4MBT8_9ACTO|nr:hypothetical protein [Actinomyces ruminis]PHP52896.1 hypothetical protein BW737_006460 [Actinomyces ruminis]
MTQPTSDRGQGQESQGQGLSPGAQGYGQYGQPGGYGAPKYGSNGGEQAPGSGQYGYVPTQSGYGYAQPGPPVGQGAATPSAGQPYPAGLQQPGMAGEDQPLKVELAPIPLSQERLVLKSNITVSGGFAFWLTAGFGLACLYGAGWYLVNEPDRIGYMLVALIAGLASLALVVAMWRSHTVLDATGIHLHAFGQTRDFPWPTSRTSLFARVTLGKVVKSADACMVMPDGQAMVLTGLSWMGAWPPSLEARAVAQCSRIWDWAVARGYTQETHEYIPLSGVTWQAQQLVRESQERRYGLR